MSETNLPMYAWQLHSTGSHIINIESRTRYVKAYISPHRRLRRLGLKEAGRLFRVNPQLCDEVSLNQIIPREVASRAIWARPWWLRGMVAR